MPSRTSSSTTTSRRASTLSTFALSSLLSLDNRADFPFCPPAAANAGSPPTEERWDSFARLASGPRRRSTPTSPRSEVNRLLFPPFSSRSETDASPPVPRPFPGIAATLATLLLVRSKLNSSTEETKKVKELVQVALTKLQHQERAHYADPVQTAEPFIAPAHLRDFILASEPSPAARQRLWSKVGKVVEGNANVRTRETEVRGEVHSVWEWKGGNLA